VILKKVNFLLAIANKSYLENFPSWEKWEWDRNHSLLIVFGLSSKTQWLSGLYYA